MFILHVGRLRRASGHRLLMREDWTAIPELFDLARRTTRVIKGNLVFTIGYNIVGVLLAALGILPPVIAHGACNREDVAKTVRKKPKR